MKWEQERCLPDYCSVKIRQDGVCLDLSLFVFIGVLNAHLNSSNLKNNGYAKAFQQMPTTQIIIIWVTEGKEMRGRRGKGKQYPAAAVWIHIVQHPNSHKGRVFFPIEFACICPNSESRDLQLHTNIQVFTNTEFNGTAHNYHRICSHCCHPDTLMQLK